MERSEISLEFTVLLGKDWTSVQNVHERTDISRKVGVLHPCNSSTLEVKTWGSGIQSHHEIQTDYMEGWRVQPGLYEISL